MSSAGVRPLPPVDESLFRSAYAAHQRFVRTFARSAGIPNAELDDVVQEVFLVLHRRWYELDAPLQAKPWLRGVSARVCANHRRSRLRSRANDKQQLEPETLLLPVHLLPEQQAVRKQESRILASALAGLKLEQRQALLSVEFEERSAAEIALQTGISASTIATRVKAARRQLARTLKRGIATECVMPPHLGKGPRLEQSP